MVALLLLLAPAALLFVVLSLGRYPGERLLEPIGQARWTLRFTHRRAASVRARPPVVLLPRGGRLVAHALAGRGPPCF